MRMQANLGQSEGRAHNAADIIPAGTNDQTDSPACPLRSSGIDHSRPVSPEESDKDLRANVARLRNSSARCNELTMSGRLRS